MRMFVALLPPPFVVDDLDARVGAWRTGHPALRCTPLEQWHITLAFLPDVAPERLGQLCARLERAARRREPLELRLAGGLAFPRPARARTLGVGVRAVAADGLRHLAVGCQAAARKSGVETDQRHFRPHLTLARLRRPGDAAEWLPLLADYAGPQWVAAEVALVESHLGAGPGGRARHEERAMFPLGKQRAREAHRWH